MKLAWLGACYRQEAPKSNQLPFVLLVQCSDFGWWRGMQGRDATLPSQEDPNNSIGRDLEEDLLVVYLQMTQQRVFLAS